MPTGSETVFPADAADASQGTSGNRPSSSEFYRLGPSLVVNPECIDYMFVKWNTRFFILLGRVGVARESQRPRISSMYVAVVVPCFPSIP